MDQLSLSIIGVLKENPRYSLDEVSKILDVDRSKVEAIVEALEKEGVILGTSLIVNDEKLGVQNKVRALVEVRVRPKKKSGFDDIANKISKYDEVVDHYLISGDYDFMVIVEAETLLHVSQFVSNKLATIENVISTQTLFIMKKYKEDGLLTNQKSKPTRVIVHP